MRFETIPDGIRVLAPAKVNLYLEVGPLLTSGEYKGYHEIDSIFQSITLFDELELRWEPRGEIVLEEEGIREAEKNLVFRAAERLASSPIARGRTGLGARLRLCKRIPEGAGLGGGSSDAAAALLGLNVLWGLGATPAELAPLALELGSDVPFFLVGGTARCQGRGERVTDWSEAFDRYDPLHYVLAYPRRKAPTRLVYEALDAQRGPEFALTAPSPLDSMPPASVREHLGYGSVFFNRFEAVVLAAYPEVERLHAELLREPFLKVLMSGSGSTVFGVCRTAQAAEEIASRLRARVQADVFVAATLRK